MKRNDHLEIRGVSGSVKIKLIVKNYTEAGLG